MTSRISSASGSTIIVVKRTRVCSGTSVCDETETSRTPSCAANANGGTTRIATKANTDRHRTIGTLLGSFFRSARLSPSYARPGRHVRRTSEQRGTLGVHVECQHLREPGPFQQELPL